MNELLSNFMDYAPQAKNREANHEANDQRDGQ